jgi:hypothetical protein
MAIVPGSSTYDTLRAWDIAASLPGIAGLAAGSG